MPKIVDHEQRRVEIGEALLRVLARDGVQQVSIRSVAAEAGWTRGVIEHYFADRDDLLLFAYRLALKREAEVVFYSQVESPTDRLISLLLRALPIDEVSSLDFRIFLGLVGRLADRPELASALSEDHREYELRVRSYVHLAVEAGELRSDIPVETIAHHLSVFVDGLGIHCALYPESSSSETLEEKLRGFLWTLTPRESAKK
ncbi:TetR family transcriptional regulator C-terminal domain-containing protein [Leucobacter sp. L43]|uniref:TetR/AcrR family transcriptional regulator n=1 Tax=Leucobacter sp. L43 TaxID=2798040 RepID=UPI001905B804